MKYNINYVNATIYFPKASTLLSLVVVDLNFKQQGRGT